MIALEGEDLFIRQELRVFQDSVLPTSPLLASAIVRFPQHFSPQQLVQLTALRIENNLSISDTSLLFFRIARLQSSPNSDLRGLTLPLNLSMPTSWEAMEKDQFASMFAADFEHPPKSGRVDWKEIALSLALHHTVLPIPTAAGFPVGSACRAGVNICPISTAAFPSPSLEQLMAMKKAYQALDINKTGKVRCNIVSISSFLFFSCFGSLLEIVFISVLSMFWLFRSVDMGAIQASSSLVGTGRRPPEIP